MLFGVHVFLTSSVLFCGMFLSTSVNIYSNQINISSSNAQLSFLLKFISAVISTALCGSNS